MFSMRSAYAAKFAGLEIAPTAEFTWVSRAPLQDRFFVWLAMKNRCWTSDRLARRGLPHQSSCPFCGQHEETIAHIMIGCAFAREVWSKVCLALGQPDSAPTATESLPEWCIRQDEIGQHRKLARTISILVLWELWIHRNAVIFDGEAPSTQKVLKCIDSEARAWKQAGLLRGEVEGFMLGLALWVSSE